MNKRQALLMAFILALGTVLVSCAGTLVKPTESNFKAPVISLVSFEVPQYDEYWYFSKKVKPTKGKAGDRGAFLPMSFLLDIENPNAYPIKLEGITYTVAFDKNFDMITTNNNDSYWIPAGKTDQVRVTTLITVRSALVGLLLANAVTLKDKGWTPWQALERWWAGVPDLSVPVTLKQSAFTFMAEDMVKVVAFEATVP